MCVRSIEFSIIFWNCSDVMLFLAFYFITDTVASTKYYSTRTQQADFRTFLYLL
jgi:hypothetical protein